MSEMTKHFVTEKGNTIAMKAVEGQPANDSIIVHDKVICKKLLVINE